MVKVHDDLPPSMADPTVTSPTTSSTPSTSSITRYVPSRKSRPFKSLHPNSYKNSHSNFCVDPSAFSSLNPIHLHNVHNPPFHYFIHHHHCPFPPPQCAEMCNGGVISMNGEGGVAMANGGVSSGAATSGAPAKFYFGPGFEPQRAGFYAAGPGPSSASTQGRTREEYVVYLHVNPGVTISLTMGDGNVEVLRGGGFRRPVFVGGMVASQGVETSSASSTHQHHQHHHNNAATELYCSGGGAHSGFGEYYPGGEQYHYVPGAHPDMCPHMHFHQGEYGPVTVPMVSTNSSPPIAMPVQVPPGHVVQQIVDENGTLRHVILSPSHHPPGLLSLPSHNPQHYGSGGPGSGSNQSQQYYPGGIAGFPLQPYHTMQGPHPIPSPTHLGHSPPPNPAYYKDERAQRQHIKLKKKLQEKHQKGPELSPRKDLVNGLKRSPTGSTKDKGMNSVGTSEDGEESSVPDEEDSVQVVTDVLSSVQAPKVLELSSRSALLQWAPPLRLSESVSNDSGTNEIDISETDLRYEVLLSDKSREMKFKSIYNGSSHSCRIQDLKPGQEYSVCLQVHLDELQGYATDPVKFVTPACEPDQPLPPKLGAKTKNSLQLRWNQVNDNGARILFYSLEYDAGKGGEFEEIHKSRGKTQFNLQKLLPATAYRFRLAVVNEVGKSAYSDTVTYRTTENPPAQPDAPTLIEATVSTLHLKWNNRPKDEEFVLQMNDPKTKYGHMNIYNGRETYYICQRLSCYSDYTFRLKANNEGGTSPWSEEVTFRTKPDRPDRPSKPVVKGRIHAYSFRLKWEPPHNTGGAEITQYILEVNSGSGYEQVYSGSETEAVCDRLTPGTTYQLRVSCASSGGQSCPSDPCTVTTEAIGPGKCGTPKLVGKARADALTVRWAEPDYNGGAPVIDYELELTNPDSSRLLIRKNKETECTISQGIIPGQEYAFTVRAVNRICAGAWSDTLKVVSGAAPPGEPTKLTLTCRSAFHVSIEWNEPPNNGAPISDYRLEMCPDTPDDVSLFSSIYQGPLACYEAKNLSPFRKYFFRVQATNSAGVGPYSPISATITPAATPSAVSILKSESTPTTITLWWSEPNSNGSEITHYNIDLGDNVIETDGPTTEYSLENLQPETQYRIKIQAVNAVGSGNFSSTWKTSTLRLPPTPPVLECIGSGHNYLKLKWGEGKNIDYTQFSVEMENLRSKEWQCVYRGTALTCKVNKLHELTTYRFRINASNDAGIGDFSEEYQFSTGIAPPSILKMPKVTEIEQRTCTIEWLPSKNGFSDPIIYQVQIARLKEQVYKQVNRTSETKCHIENLEPGVEYCTRVCPIRVTSTSELPGPYSPTLNVTTISADVSAVTKMTPSGNCSSTAHHVFKHRTLATSLFQGVSLKKFYEENLVSIWAVLLTVAAIVMSLCIASFL